MTTTYFDNISNLQRAFHTWIDARFNSRDPDRYERASEWFYEQRHNTYWRRFDEWAQTQLSEGHIKLSRDLRDVLWGHLS